MVLDVVLVSPRQQSGSLSIRERRLIGSDYSMGLFAALVGIDLYVSSDRFSCLTFDQ